MPALFKVLGYDDGVHICDCCGKSDLKGTFGIEMIETGEELFYGSVCVTRNTGYAKKELNAMARAYEAERIKAAKAEYRATAEYAASEAKFKEALALQAKDRNFIGAQFKAFVMAAADAADAVRKVIAEKHNVGFHQI
jgi:hypothetical protein